MYRNKLYEGKLNENEIFRKKVYIQECSIYGSE